MNIGIDARFYGPHGKGLGRYVQKLIEHLEKLESPHAFTVFLRRENWNRYVPQNPRFHKVLADIPWYSVKEQLLLPSLMRRESIDLMHFPHYNVPLFYRKPFLITIHDLIVSRFPTRRASTLGPLPFALKQAAYRTVIRSAVHRARHILTVSEFSKREIMHHFGTPADAITVTYEAADPVPAAPREDPWAEKHRQYAPYLLYVGNAYPHKNLEGLLEAFVRVRARWQQPLRLVLVGKMDYFYERVRRQAHELGLSEIVVFPGYVEDDELQSLYRHALLYVFPSFDEGFGLPPLEAMRAGVPVLSSNRSCLPEILGNAAAYFPPEDPEAIASAILALLRDPEQQKVLRERGFAQAEKYRWDDLARTTLGVYTTLVNPAPIARR